jgi:hypothetical protein
MEDIHADGAGVTGDLAVQNSPVNKPLILRAPEV